MFPQRGRARVVCTTLMIPVVQVPALVYTADTPRQRCEGQQRVEAVWKPRASGSTLCDVAGWTNCSSQFESDPSNLLLLNQAN